MLQLIFCFRLLFLNTSVEYLSIPIDTCCINVDDFSYSDGLFLFKSKDSQQMILCKNGEQSIIVEEKSPIGDYHIKKDTLIYIKLFRNFDAININSIKLTLTTKKINCTFTSNLVLKTGGHPYLTNNDDLFIPLDTGFLIKKLFSDSISMHYNKNIYDFLSRVTEESNGLFTCLADIPAEGICIVKFQNNSIIYKENIVEKYKLGTLGANDKVIFENNKIYLFQATEKSSRLIAFNEKQLEGKTIYSCNKKASILGFGIINFT